MPERRCPDDKVLNPASGRCVKKDGRIGRSLVYGPQPRRQCPDRTILNPASGRCVNVEGPTGRRLRGLDPAPRRGGNAQRRRRQSPPQPRNVRPGDCIERSAIPLREHQIKVARHLRRNNELLVVHSTGTGKTLTAVAASQCFLDANPQRKVIVVCPASVTQNFERELERYGVPDQRKYEVYSFAKFRRDSDNGLIRATGNMLIIDEAHTVRTLRSATYKACQKAADRAAKRVLLTATPYVNKIGDLTAICKLLYGRTELPARNDEAPLEYFLRILRNKVDVVGRSTNDYPDRRDFTINIPISEQEFTRYGDLLLQNTEYSEGTGYRDAFYGFLRQSTNLLQNTRAERIKVEEIFRLTRNTKSVVYTNYLTEGVRKLEQNTVTITFLIVSLKERFPSREDSVL